MKEEVEKRLTKLTAEQKKKIEDLRARVCTVVGFSAPALTCSVQNAELEEVCNGLEGNLAASGQRCSGLEADLEGCSEKVGSLEGEVQQLQAELNEAGENLLRRLARAAEEQEMAIEEAIIAKEKACDRFSDPPVDLPCH